MLRNFLIFSLCFVAIRACGEFSVLSSPKSLTFKGNDALQSEYVGDVISAAMGFPVNGNAQWPAFNLIDPFHLAKSGVAVQCEGINHLSLSSNAKTYPMKGDKADESLKAVAAELEASNVDVCDIDFNNFDEALLKYQACFGVDAVPSVQSTKNLDATSSVADKQILQIVELLNLAANNWSQKDNRFVIFRMSLETIAKEHGEKSISHAEASKLVSAGIANLSEAVRKASNNQDLFVVMANKASGQRSKRDVKPRADAATTTYNLAEYYNEDYPVIFNIILWFMVTFGLALLAICYAIGSMDPGRDSIIYRMTSTRMKKDN